MDSILSRRIKNIIKIVKNALFEEISDLHVKHSAKIISQRLRNLKAAFDERHSKKTVQEYKAFVQRMPQLNKERDSLTNHSDLCAKVIGSLSENIVELRGQIIKNIIKYDIGLRLLVIIFLF